MGKSEYTRSMIKRTWILRIGGLILLAAIGLFLGIRGIIQWKNGPIVEVHFIHSWEKEAAQVLAAKIRLFQMLNQDIRVNLEFLPEQQLRQSIPAGEKIPDLFLWEGPLERSFPFKVSPPYRWTGNSWTLAVNPTLLSEEQLALLIDKPSLQEFELLLEQLHRQGITPLSVGNSHLWPLTLWAQHIQVSLEGTKVANQLPRINNEESASNKAWKVLRDWKQKGYFLESSWNKGWAIGISSVVQGEAAICLMSGDMIVAIPRTRRQELTYLPFPQNNKHPWFIGRGTSILVNQDSSHPKEVQKLLDFLTSEGITQSMTESLDKLFFMATESEPEVYIPSWEKLANTPEMQKYGEALKRFVE